MLFFRSMRDALWAGGLLLALSLATSAGDPPRGSPQSPPRQAEPDRLGFAGPIADAYQRVMVEPAARWEQAALGVAALRRQAAESARYGQDTGRYVAETGAAWRAALGPSYPNWVPVTEAFRGRLRELGRRGDLRTVPQHAEAWAAIADALEAQRP